MGKEITVESKLVEIIDQVQSGLAKAGALASEHAPQAVDALLWVKRIEGIQVLATSLLFLVIGIAGLVAVYKLGKKSVLLLKDYEDAGAPLLALTIMIAVFAFPFTFKSIYAILDVWNYVAIFKPELAIAHDIIETVKASSGK